MLKDFQIVIVGLVIVPLDELKSPSIFNVGLVMFQEVNILVSHFILVNQFTFSFQLLRFRDQLIVRVVLLVVKNPSFFIS
jgi:hypothetical protein